MRKFFRTTPRLQIEYFNKAGMSRKKCGKKVFLKESEIGPERRLPGFSSLMRPENEAKRQYWLNGKDLVGQRPFYSHFVVIFWQFRRACPVKKAATQKTLDCRLPSGYYLNLNCLPIK
jgi:hypothetical protein